MGPNRHETSDLVRLTENVLNGKLHFLWSVMFDEIIESYQEETNFNQKKQPVKLKISILDFHFYQLLWHY